MTACTDMEYHHFVRREIGPLLPADASHILEVGAGAGSTLKWLKDVFPAAETTAVEINSSLAEELKSNVDRALLGGIEDTFPQLRQYDLILLLDVLEHLADSAAVLRNLASLLTPAGSVIVSLPNIAHWSVSVPLLLQGRFEYQDAGIMDRTHLRFFVKETAVRLLNDAGLVVDRGLISGLQGPKTRLADSITLGLLRDRLAKQYIMRGQINAKRLPQPSIRWSVAH